MRCTPALCWLLTGQRAVPITLRRLFEGAVAASIDLVKTVCAGQTWICPVTAFWFETESGREKPFTVK